jgi:hypothetical protein
MNAYEIPSLRFSMPAGGTVAKYRFVTVNANGNGIQAIATSNIIGASMNQAKSGEVLEIADGIVMIEAADTIAPGASVSADADGKAITTASGIVAGIAITAGVAGGLMAIKIN